MDDNEDALIERVRRRAQAGGAAVGSAVTDSAAEAAEVAIGFALPPHRP